MSRNPRETLGAAKKSGSTDFIWKGMTEVSMGVGWGGCGKGDNMEQKTIPGRLAVLRKERPNAGEGLREEKGYVLNVWTFSSIDENTFEFVEHQIDNLAWLNISARDLKQSIDECGTISEYNNGGGQSGLRENPDVKTLIAYQKNILAITKQLLDLVPASTKKSKLQDFLK